MNGKTFTIEWSALLSALIVLTLSLIISVVMILYSYQYYNKTYNWERQKDREFGALEREYTFLQESIANNLYLKKFNQLKKKGFFLDAQAINIDEQRMKMRDDIKKRLEKLPLPSMDFSVKETHYLLPPELVINIEEQVKIYETPIHFELGLLHEGDLLNLIKIIELYQRQSMGLFNWQNCDLKRNSDNIDVKDISKPYFNANCILVWSMARINE